MDWTIIWSAAECCINIQLQDFLKFSCFNILLNRLDVLLTVSSFYVLTALLGGAAAGLGSSLGAVPGGQPSAPNLNPPSQIDPSSIERAYAALGLTYQGNQIQTPTAQSNMPNQGMQGQAGMRPLNPMGELLYTVFNMEICTFPCSS